MPPEIAGRRIGRSHPAFVVAEIGLYHGGRLTEALALVDAAADAGASAVKLQTLHADTLVAPHCPAPAHVSVSSLRAFFEAFELGADEHRIIVERARRHGLAVMSTPFSEAALPMLEALNLDAYKIASGDLTFDSLITAAAQTGRPLILSTGMSSLFEVGRAIGVAGRAGADNVALLHCVSAYPTPVASQNLRAISTLADEFSLPVGLSDHGADTFAAVPAVALGACIYERHFVLAGDDQAVDAPVSSDQTQLAAAITAMAQTRLALGDGRKICQPAEQVNVHASRRGLYARRTLRSGHRVGPDDLIALRPATEFAPEALPGVLGAVLSCDIEAGAPLQARDLTGITV
jgi:sialic acid synthase SpsE